MCRQHKKKTEQPSTFTLIRYEALMFKHANNKNKIVDTKTDENAVFAVITIYLDSTLCECKNEQIQFG